MLGKMRTPHLVREEELGAERARSLTPCSPTLLGGLEPFGHKNLFFRFFLILLSPVSGHGANSKDSSS